ncbi:MULTISPECIES: nucleotide disphospho-sugar-binding domain-containing protein [Actinoalloteichus]|uniref:Glycosyl transferase, UDP-glucuronosyltransferase n=1 Tax=Actinoalloteichus fjordicus TaxID=1612552 RepID=A0AAC9LFU1_9PSEU|nr:MULTISPECIES: nucleotide disphospho-sugar-binding domain-containing protein [Actinoalloteichus]APU15535.1 glycosyl transferase, UDP-glucuronosyltransferase [Actinoalloteichus fjordicus]APU21602.1 glycosyl transferase, UDP-glucuronosyltransferase [Actinoalloteichus sp. GBA129-24]
MRVLFVVYPSHAHFWPAVPCAWALQSAGHEVRVASHARFEGSVTAAGLTPVGLGDARVDEARTRPDARAPSHPEEVLRYADALGLDAAAREHWIAYFQWLLNPISDYVRTDLPYADELIDFARDWRPDLVIWDPTFACGPVAAKVSGAAHARMLIGPDYLAWSLDRLAERRTELLAAGLSPNPQAELMAPLAEKYGMEVDDELLYGQWSIDPMPPGLVLPTSTTTLSMRYVPYNGAEPFPRWLHRRPERPRVALSLGESTRRFIKGDWGRTPKILEAVDGLDVEMIATVNAPQLEGVERIPDNVRTIEWVPLTQLMPTCSVLIHHGGLGTFGAPVAAKVPQIVCDTGETLMMQPVEVDPKMPGDGTYRVGFEFGISEDVVEKVTSWELPAKKLEATPTADYVVGRGAGLRLNHRTQSVEEIRAVILTAVEDPAIQRGAQDVFDTWLAMPSPADVVPLLERMTLEHRRG